jgi:hypothetical protein
MKDTAVAKTNGSPGGAIVEQVIAKGNLAQLTPEERTRYYTEVCRSVGLNPLTRPLEYITLNGKLTLYARRDAADQLRKLHGISIEIVERSVLEGLITVHVRAKDRDGRTDEDLGVVSVANLKGEAAANAMLKAITKAKRRVTLSIAGMGFLDETEVEDIPPEAKAEPAHIANKTSKDLDWRGPLTKTKLQEELRNFVKAIPSVDTPPELESLLDEFASVIEQCKKDIPGWWTGEGMNTDFVPIEKRIEQARDKVEHGVIEDGPGDKPDWQTFDRNVRDQIAASMAEDELRDLQVKYAAEITEYSRANERAAQLLNKAFGDRYLMLSQRPLDE